MQILAWLSTFKPKQLVRTGNVPLLVKSLCILATERDPENYDVSDPFHDSLPPRKFAAQAIDSLALGVPAKYILPAVLEFSEQACVHEEARVRAAGCSLFGVASEGCGEAIKAKGKVGGILAAVVRCTDDADSSVRGEAASCIGQMASTYHRLNCTICAGTYRLSCTKLY
jgi:importin-4